MSESNCVWNKILITEEGDEQEAFHLIISEQGLYDKILSIVKKRIEDGQYDDEDRPAELSYIEKVRTESCAAYALLLFGARKENPDENWKLVDLESQL